MQYSIILPVRNGEKTLPECLSALLSQPCRDMELLLLDRGSEDGTEMLCRGYEAAYPDMVRVVRLKDAGLNAARNEGIRQARGAYLLFADCADRMVPEALASLSHRIEACPADLYLPVREGLFQRREEAVSLEDCPALLTADVDIRDALWKRQLFDDAYLRFPEESGYEGMRMICKALALSRSIAALPGRIWREREQEFTSERELALLDALDDVLGYFRHRGLLPCYGIWLTRMAALRLCDRASCVLTEKKNPASLAECIRYLKNRFPEYRSVSMPEWRGRDTQKLLNMIEQERWTRLRLVFLAQMRKNRYRAQHFPGGTV